MTARVAVFVSGGGTNLQALLDAQAAHVLPDAEISLVVSNKPDAQALERARTAGVEAVFVDGGGTDSSEFESKASELLEDRGIDLIVLAGFNQILSQDFTSRYEDRILNIHPSLIPSFSGRGYYGLKVHDAALEAGVDVTGATVHFVDEVPDGGQILAQQTVSVEPGDTPTALQRRVMEQAEWSLLPQALQDVAANLTAQQAKKEPLDLPALLSKNPYPGRGLALGTTPLGDCVLVYFIMGRSQNSRNRVFARTEDGIRTKAFDPTKLEDPSLIIYHPVRTVGEEVVVTNGDQTDTIAEFLQDGSTFEAALCTRTFEPDAPNFTPRISGKVNADGSYSLSILKATDPSGSHVKRQFFPYEPAAGLGHFIHTYDGDAPVLPSFSGSPKLVAIPQDIESFAKQIWGSLDSENRVALYVRSWPVGQDTYQDVLINRHLEES